MDAGVHLPLIDFSGGGFSYRRLAETVDAARACGFGAVSANDHFLFSAPWLDGLTALAAVIERSGGMKLVTTVALAALRGPVPLAKALSALDELSDGRVIAGVGPGSSRADYDAVGVPFEQRWQRFDETLQLIKAMLQPATAGSDGAPAQSLLSPSRPGRGIPVWIGSWGSRAGMRRVARAADGWLASAYNTTPEAFTAAMEVLGGELESQQRPSGDFPECACHDVGLDYRQPPGGRPGSVRDRRSAGQARPGRAPRPDLRRLGGRVRRAAVPLCPRGVPASPLLASG